MKKSNENKICPFINGKCLQDKCMFYLPIAKEMKANSDQFDAGFNMPPFIGMNSFSCLIALGGMKAFMEITMMAEDMEEMDDDDDIPFD